jgi:hypothetical protein
MNAKLSLFADNPLGFAMRKLNNLHTRVIGDLHAAGLMASGWWLRTSS